MEKCVVCGLAAAHKCSGCHNVSYCGKEHQIKDWKSGHKTCCKCYKVKSNNILGRHLVSTRMIKRGEIIYKEHPIVVGPKIASTVMCLGCYKSLLEPNRQEDYYKCSKCGWPLCGVGCESAAAHVDECKLMSSRMFKSQIKFDGDVNKKESAYCVIVPLRVLLLAKKNVKLFTTIMGLESHIEERMESPLYNVIKSNLVPFIRNVLGLDEYNEEMILNLSGILDTNSYEIRLPKNASKIRGLYDLGAMMSHDCVTNTRHYFENFQMVLIATVDIPKGETISVSYTQPLKCTLQRRIAMRQAKCFDCTCKRCSDPTELGTYCGSTMCPQCHDNKIVSTNPLDNYALWKCENVNCDYRETYQQVNASYNSIRNEVLTINKSSPVHFECFLKKYEKILNPFNTHVLEVKYVLTQMYGNIPGYYLKEMNTNELERKIQLCSELLHVANILEPGASFFRGNILLDIQCAKVIKAKREFQNEDITSKAFQKNISDILISLNEAAEILKIDPNFNDELQGKIAFVMKEMNVD